MANMLIPIEERNLSPNEVARLDARRRQGHFLVVMGFQTFIVGCIVMLWAPDDWTYSPHWAHPMVYWDMVLFLTSLICFSFGLRMRRGVNEFISY